jgi:hypothetical protein
MVGLGVARGDSQGKHARCHTGAAEHEELAAAEAVDGEEGDEAGQELPSQRATREDARRLAVEAEALLEDDGRVGRDEVATAHLLEELEEDAKRETVEQLVLAIGEDVAELDGGALSFLERQFNAANLSSDCGVVKGKTLERRQAVARLLDTALVDEPTRGLRNHEDSNHGDEGDGCGDGEGNAPLQGQVVLLVEAKVDPGLEQVAQTDKASIEDDVLAAVGRRRTLGLPDRNCRTEDSNTPSENEATDDELRSLECSALQDLADKGQEGTAKDELATTEGVANPRGAEGTKESTDGKGSNLTGLALTPSCFLQEPSTYDGTLDGRLAALLSTVGIDDVDVREVVIPVTEGEQTTDTRLVVSEEDEGRQDDQQQLDHLQGGSRKAHGDG